ncbi:PAP2 family protein [alpha proteobacterium U9-1i]|nr:PAP2 family protein [alpha proteobacterium U9-1i]
MVSRRERLGADAGDDVRFNIDAMEWLAAHRSPVLTDFFQFWTAFGDVQGYVLVFALLFMAVDKPLAVRFGVIALVAMSLNHVLKELIQNPRPFIEGELYLQRWAVSTDTAAALAREYSTPSGHAMAAGAAYTYLAGLLRKPYVLVGALVVIVLVGASRPYLGVHYVEDILLGWIIGGCLALLALRYAGAAPSAWSRLRAPLRIALCAAFSASVWLATVALNGWSLVGVPHAFISQLGFLTGLMVAWPWEARRLRFDPRSATIAIKTVRVALCVALVAVTLVVLDQIVERIASDDTILGHALRYLRYVASASVGVLLAPLLCVRLGLGAASADIIRPSHTAA